MTLGPIELEELAEEPDVRLLESFATARCEAAFCELVRRHTTMVRATALRICGDQALAEEIAQNTLLVLARKARRIKIPEGGSVGVWLHRVAVLEARNACKKEQRRMQRMHKLSEEIQAVNQEVVDDPNWGTALQHLDHAINTLSEKDRQLIIMRFMEEQRFREIGFALGGLSPDAVRMKTKRVVDKLSTLLKRRGAGVPAAMIVAGLAALGSPKLSAANAGERSRELLALASQPSALGVLSFSGVIGTGWIARIAAFVVGFGIPVAYSAYDRGSRAPSFEAENSPESGIGRRGVRTTLTATMKNSRGSDLTPLQRLLEQIAQLENEFQAPSVLAEALESVLSLELEQLPLVWETACAESPPRVLIDAIIIRWAELDPLEALAICGEIDDGMKQASVAIEVWYQADPQKATAHFRERPAEFFESGRKYFWQTFALFDPGLGLQVSAELGSGDLLPQIYRYTLLQGWFQSQGLEFLTTHLQERPKTYLPFNGQIAKKIEEMPALNAEQLTGTLMWVGGIQKREDRLGYVDLLMSKLAPDADAELRDWVSDSPLLPEDLRASLLEHPNLR